jgi:molybdopterin-guanine dinucleotide biosynthesis protein MobB
MKTLTIAIVGSKKSGKTRTIETAIKELTKRGYSVAAVKHVSEPDFTIDSKGKDTWRFAQSGAKTIIAIAANEIATIEKVATKDFSLKEILQKCEGNDVVLIEGLKNLVGKDKNVQKVVVVKSTKETLRVMKDYEPILAFVRPCSTENLNLKIPHVDILKNPKKIADIIENLIEQKKKR